jgi:hypothetical protein
MPSMSPTISLYSVLFALFISLPSAPAFSQGTATWFWVNRTSAQLPRCVPLTWGETPIQSVERTYGKGRVRLKESFPNREGRVDVLEVAHPGEEPLLVSFSTTREMCARLHAALDRVNTEAPKSPSTWTRDSLRRHATGLAKQDLVRQFGRPSNLVDNASSNNELWSYHDGRIAVRDPEAGYLSVVRFWLSKETGRVVQVDF